MSMKTNKLRKAIVVLVVAALILLPNLIAFADETEGPQGTPVPEVTADNGEDEGGGDQTGDDQSGGEESGDDQSGDDQSGDDQSGDDQSGDDQSGDDQSGDDQSGDDQSGDDQSGDDQSGDDQSGDDQSGDNQSGDDGSGDDQSGDDQSGDEQSGDDQSGDDQSGDDGSGDDQSGDDQSGDDGSGDDGEEGTPPAPPAAPMGVDGAPQPEADTMEVNFNVWFHNAEGLASYSVKVQEQEHKRFGFMDWRWVDKGSPYYLTVTFGSGSFDMVENRSIPYHSIVTVTANNKTNPTYTFDKWSTLTSGSHSGNTTKFTVLGVGYGAHALFNPPPSYTINFYDYDGTLLSSQSVMKGTDAVPPTNLDKQDRVFTGWDSDDWKDVDGPANITAQYALKPILKFHYVEGLTGYSCTANGSPISVPTPTPSSTVKTVYAPIGSTIVIGATVVGSHSLDGFESAPFSGQGVDPAESGVTYEFKAMTTRTHYALQLVKGNNDIADFSVSAGSTSGNYGSQTIYIPINMEVSVTANPAGGKVFDYWESNYDAPPVGSRNGNYWPFKMEDNYKVVAYGEDIDHIDPFNGTFRITHQGFGGSSSGSVKVYYNGNTYGPYSPGQFVDIQYVDGQNTVKVQALPNATPPTMFIQWANHGGVTTEYMDINLTTGQGSAGSAPNSLECILGEIEIIVKPQFEQVGSLTITKKDKDTNLTISGATFQLKNSSGAVMPGSVNGGVYTWNNLPEGTYQLKELSPPSGYEAPSPDTWTVRIGTNGGIDGLECTNTNWNPTGIVKNKALYGSISLQKAVQGTQDLSGFEFTLTGGPASVNLPVTTTASGKITWDDLQPGTYYINETARDGFYLDPLVQSNNVSVTVSAGNESKVTFTNSECGSISLQKALNGTHDLSGFVFTLKDSSGNIVGSSKTTDATGKLTWDNLPAGKYYLNEAARDGFYLDPAVQSNNVEVDVTYGNESKVTFTNCEYGSISLQKALNGTHDLSGFVFTLKDEGGNIVGSSKTTDTTGKLTWDNLPEGKYYLSEAARDGFYLNPLVQSNNVEVDVTYGNESKVTFTNCEYGSIKVVKTANDSQTPLKGVTFTLTKLSVDPNAGYTVSGTTNDSGIIEWPDLEPGDYTVLETVPDGYYVLPGEASHYVNLTYAQDEVINVTNYEYVEIYAKKADIITGAPLSGAKFAIYNSSGSGPEGDAIATRTTGSDGIAKFGKDLKLKAGTYWIKEIDPPLGYQNDPATATGYPVTIEAHGGNNIESPVLFENTPNPGDFAFQKRDTDNPSILLGRAVYHLSGMHWNGSSLVPITYELTTNTSGYASVTGLTPGNYILQEVTAPFGYAVDPNPHPVVIYSGRTTQGEDIEQVSNEELEHGSIVIIKYATNSTYRLQGAEFSLFKKHYDGTLELVSTLTTDVSGNIAWNDLQAGTYEIVENSAPAGYTIVSQSTNVTLNPGARAEVVIYNNGPTPTTTTPTTPPVNPPETTPSPSPSPSPTPVPTATPTPINTDEVEIADVDPAFGPETGEGDGLFMTIGILLLMAATLFVIKKKAVLKR